MDSSQSHPASKIPKLSPPIKTKENDYFALNKPKSKQDHNNLTPKKMRPFRRSQEVQSSFGTPPHLSTAVPRVTVQLNESHQSTSMHQPCMNCACCKYIKDIQPILMQLYERQKKMSEMISRLK